MPRPWNVIDWDEARPSLGSLIDSWESVRWSQIPLESPSLDEFVAEVRRSHVNGGILLGRWRAEQYSDVTAWFAARNRLDEYELHRLLFDSQEVRSALDALRIPATLERVPGNLSEVPGGALMLEGMLAHEIVTGGAYHAFEGSAAEAKDLAARVVDELIGRRYEDIRVDETFAAWTPWFFEIAWDHTLVLTDYARAEMTVLCITDTD